jgi:hypothetical protein
MKEKPLPTNFTNPDASGERLVQGDSTDIRGFMTHRDSWAKLCQIKQHFEREEVSFNGHDT